MGETCQEKNWLLDQYSRATKELSTRGRELSTVAISYEMDAFQRAWNRCEEARRRCVDCRHRIAAHLAEHGCGFGG